MPFLLDVNVLIARIDPRHEHHERVARWERDNASEHLVTCPLTQNGFVRIYGHPRYPGGPGSPAEAMVELRYPLSLTDVYLLGLAVSEGIDFATTDSRIHHETVVRGKEKLYVIPAP